MNVTDMIAKPNKTELKGTVRAVRPEADGVGAEVELEVLENTTPAPEDDFLRPQAGSIVKAHFAKPESVKVGQTVHAAVSLSGGPFGQRAVIRSVRPA
jgi:hypothetical protein